MSFPLPQHFHPELTDERLSIIAEALLDVRFNTIRLLDGPLDDNYTREGPAFGRSKNMLIALCNSGKYDWLRLISSDMKAEFRIGNVVCRFFRDDSNRPKKRGFFKQGCHTGDLFGSTENIPKLWRFVVERAVTEENEDQVFFIGYNAYHEKISQWVYAASNPVLYSVDNITPPSKDIPPAHVGLPEDDLEQNDATQNE